MNEQLLKMNGLSMEILDALSFESHLGIPLKKNLHYFDKDSLITELMAMTEWLDEQEILSDIALDYRVKSLDSILLKYDRYYPNHQTRKVFNDILGFRAFCDSYDPILEESSQFRIADMSTGKAVDDGCRARVLDPCKRPSSIDQGLAWKYRAEQISKILKGVQ